MQKGILYICAVTKKLFTKDAAIVEAQAALLAVHTVASCSVLLEGDALNVVLAVQKPHLFDV